MRLLFVGTDRDRAGGAAHFIALTKAMAGAGHDAQVLADRNSAIGQAIQNAGLPMQHARFRNVLDLRAHFALLRTIRRHRSEWLIGNFGREYWPLIAHGCLSGAKVALFRHRTPALKGASDYLVPRLAHRFVTVSKCARELLLQRGMPPERVQVLYNPVDTVSFRPDLEQGRLIRQSLGIPEDAIVVGFVGRMYGGKGIFCLQEAASEAMRQRADLHCLWIGDGPQMDELKQTIEADSSAPRHHMVGWREDTSRYYNAMSMLAFPSTYTETFGRVSIEAQACGVPVLGSRHGGIPESLLDGGSGRLLEPGNVAAWRDGILALCDTATRERMAATARAFAEQHFGFAHIASDFATLLQSARSRNATAH
jgi:glycosyltransferase involved in cell wall biosynthesis